jgi:hypothetical protein
VSLENRYVVIILCFNDYAATIAVATRVLHTITHTLSIQLRASAAVASVSIEPACNIISVYIECVYQLIALASVAHTNIRILCTMLSLYAHYYCARESFLPLKYDQEAVFSKRYHASTGVTGYCLALEKDAQVS